MGLRVHLGRGRVVLSLDGGSSFMMMFLKARTQQTTVLVWAGRVNGFHSEFWPGVSAPLLEGLRPRDAQGRKTVSLILMRDKRHKMQSRVREESSVRMKGALTPSLRLPLEEAP